MEYWGIEPSQKGILSITQDCIRWWGSISEALVGSFVGWFVFYDISTLVGYLISNTVHTCIKYDL